jgi:riboflavin synthase
MFSGIIYNKGVLYNLKKFKKTSYIEIKTQMNLSKYDIGSSINTNGVCLTLTEIKKNSIFFYLSNETLIRTNFKNINIKSSINLEKSLTFGNKISGHYVQGHVDTTGCIKNITIIDKTWNIFVEVDDKYRIHLVEKASIALNGVSLTIAKVKKNIFIISIIPHTLKLTNLVNLKRNDMVNIEFDIFSKYLMKLSK